MSISVRFLDELNKYEISAYTIEVKYNVKGAQQKITNYKKGRTSSIPIDVIEGACIGEPRIDVEYVVTGRKSKDEFISKIGTIASTIENLNKQIDIRDSRIKELENALSLAKKAM